MNKEYFKFLYQKLFHREKWREFIKKAKEFNKKSLESGCMPIDVDLYFPCVNDNTNSISFDAHYVYHPAWAARVLAELSPEEHIDISSTINFSTVVSAFIPVKYYEYRPVDFKLSGLESKKVDLINLPFEDNSIYSLSCMHVVEHIGLGRYGDEIDPWGDLKAIQELKRVVKVGGNLLFVVPIGKEKIIFNAHRIYSYERIMQYFSKERWKLKKFSLILDDKSNFNTICAFGIKSSFSKKGMKVELIKDCFIENAKKEQADQQEYGCGCFWFEKVL